MCAIQSLVPRPLASLETVHTILGSLVARYRQEEVLTAVWQIPARDAKFRAALACELWKDAVGNSRHGYEAYEQLTIYYEHKVRQPEQAQLIVQQALEELRRAIQVGKIAPGPYCEIKKRFDHRRERLARKSKRPLLNGLAIKA
jgi:hypothetical protein